MTMSIKDKKNSKRRAAYKASTKINKGDQNKIASQQQMIADQAAIIQVQAKAYIEWQAMAKKWEDTGQELVAHIQELEAKLKAS